MLDIGFSEFVVIGVVALIVIGPERLPRVARTAGHLLGRFQRYVAEVKADINREIELAELKTLQTSVEDAARSIEHSVKAGMDEAHKELREAQAALEQTGGELKKTEDALKEAVSGVSPHMGTALAEQPGPESGSGTSPAMADAPLGGQPSPPGHAGVHDTLHEEASPQLELALDSGPPSVAPKQG